MPWPAIVATAGTLVGLLAYEGRAAWWQWSILAVVYALLMVVMLLPARLTHPE